MVDGPESPDDGTMSNEPTPDTPDADEPASSDVDPTVVESSDTPPAVDTGADPTIDVMSDRSDADQPVVDDDDPDPAIDSDPDGETRSDEFQDADPTIDVMSDLPPEPDPEPLGEPAATATGGPGGGSGEAYVPPQPAPPYVAAPPVRRLVRDPYSRLGGVCSGIAHHTGVDVSLVRLGFVLATFFSGIGLILYLLAWLIVPRAEYWPPAPYEAGRSGGSLLEGRQLAYGLLAIGIILVIFSGAGGFARMLVSVGLVGAGIWMLVQPQSESKASAPTVDGPPAPPTGTPIATTMPTASANPAGTPVDSTAVPVVDDVTGVVPSTWQPAPGDVGPDTSVDDVTSSFIGSDASTTATAASVGQAIPPGPIKTVYVPSPVPPRRRRVWPIFLILALLIIPLLAIAGAIIFVAVADEEFAETDVLITPQSVEEIPGRIDEGAGTITLDLTELDVTDFPATAAAVQEVEIDLNAGEVVVDLPPDFPVTVDASAGAGEITVLDRYEEGIRPRITADDADAVLELDIRVGVGSISVDD